MDESKKPEIKKDASKKPAPLSDKKSPLAPETDDPFFDEISARLDMMLSENADDIAPKVPETKIPPPPAEVKKPAVKDIEPEARTVQKEKDARRPAVKKPEDMRKEAPQDKKKLIQKESPPKESDGKFKRVKIVKASQKKSLQDAPPDKPAPERKPSLPSAPSGEKQHQHMKFHAPPRSPHKEEEKDAHASAMQKPEDTRIVAGKVIKKPIEKAAPLKREKEADTPAIQKPEDVPKIAGKEKKELIKKNTPLKAAEKDQRKVKIVKASKVKTQKTRKKSFLVYGLLGILVVSAAAALSLFWGSPEQSKRTEAVKTPPPHKIARPPVKVQANREIPPEKKKTPLPLLSNTAKKPATSPTVPKKIEQIIPLKKADPAAEINTFLAAWKKAWENSAGKQGDIETYMAFYADSFFSQGFDKNRWEQDKRLKNRRKDWIRIDLKQIQTGPVTEDRVPVRFLQDYRSSNYSGISYKTLMLKKEPAGWRIIGTEAFSGAFPYSIFMDSYRSKEPAEKEIKEYRNRGLQAFWTRTDLGEKGVWFRVFIGCYKTFGEAQKIITDMQLANAKPVEIKYASAIGIYSSEDNLTKEIRKLSDSGYSSYVVKDDGGKSHLYVGAFYTLQNAEKLSAEMRSQGFGSQAIRR